MILAYRMSRSTEDVDLLLDDPEIQFLAEERDLGSALEQTNTELAPLGLYLTHIWGPEQQILTPTWRESCRRIHVQGLFKLGVTVLGPLDLITSKLCRADALDLADIEWLIRQERLASDQVRRAMETAIVPSDFVDGYGAACARVERLLAKVPH
jgi:hypothetical protein